VVVGAALVVVVGAAVVGGLVFVGGGGKVVVDPGAAVVVVVGAAVVVVVGAAVVVVVGGIEKEAALKLLSRLKNVDEPAARPVFGPGAAGTEKLTVPVSQLFVLP
jgi:hypothetical protein